MKAGLPPAVQQALDIVRVVGNESVHPGTIDVRDNTETVSRLFGLVNFIAKKTISEPKEIESMFAGLPSEKLAAIRTRDS